LTPYRSEYYPGIGVNWLWQQRFGGAWLGVMADEKDRLFALSEASILCRYPSHAPADAIPLIGDDRNIKRGFGETDADYAVRLQRCWTFWQWSGTGLGIVINLQASGFTGIPWTTAETPFDPYYPDTTSSVFVIRNSDVAAGNLLDDGYQFWSRFWVYMDSDLESITYDGIWSDAGDYDDGGVWDLELLGSDLITPSMVGSWKASIRQSKPAEWSCASINLGGTSDIPGGLVQIPMDSYDLTLGLGERDEFTFFGQINNIADWFAATGSVTIEVGKTTIIDATFVIRASGAGNQSAWYRRVFAIESLPFGLRFVGLYATSFGFFTANGCDIASESSAPAIFTGGAFDVQAKLNTTTNALTFEAKAPAIGLFAVNFREIEL
jgi:hypothetical protein